MHTSQGLSLIAVACLFSLALVTPVSGELKADVGVAGVIPKLTDQEKAGGPELYSSSVYPFFGSPCTEFTYSVFYRDKDGTPPEYVRIWHAGVWHDLEKESGDFSSGALYTFKYVPTSGKELFYYFEASNGKGKARAGIIDSPDQGPLLYSEKLDNNEIILFDKSGNELWSYPTKKDWVEGLALSGDGKYLAAVTGNYIYLFSTSSGTPLWEYCTACGETSVGGMQFNGVAISSDGKYVAGSLGQSLHFFEGNSGEPEWSSQLEAAVIGLEMSSDGKYIAAGLGNANDKGDEIILFDSNGNKLWEYKAESPGYSQTGNFYKPAMTPDGKMVAVSSGCPDRRAYIFKGDGTVVLRSDGLTRDSPVHESGISDDGGIVAYVADQEQGKPNLFVYSGTGQRLWEHSSPDEATSRAVSVSADGKYISKGTNSGGLYLFSKDSNIPLWKFSEAGSFAKFGDVKLNPDGSMLAAGSSSKKVYLFSKGSNSPLWSREANTYVTFIEFNGEYLAAGTGARQYVFEGNSASKSEVVCTTIEKPSPMQTGGGSGSQPSGSATCGNSICEPGLGESPDVCCEDCKPGGCNGAGVQPQVSGDAADCGDGKCTLPGETSGTCPQDCCTGSECQAGAGTGNQQPAQKGWLESLIESITNFFKGLFGG